MQQLFHSKRLLRINRRWGNLTMGYLKISINSFFLIGFFSDEVDVIGYTSNQSDTDDHSSVQSLQSGSTDSGVVMSASRLTLSEMDII